MYRLIVLGIAGETIPAAQRKLLSSCSLLVGGNRLLKAASGICSETLSITPLKRTISIIRGALKQGNVGVLASGDPLFFGIGRRLIEEFGPEQIEVYPALSSMQEAMARFKLAWDDARFISLHGQSSTHVAGRLLVQPKSVVFTDGTHTPNYLAREIIHYLRLIKAYELLSSCRVRVAEDIGSDKEQLFDGSLEEASRRKFSNLNIFCLLHPGNKIQQPLGLTEPELTHSRGLITKNEVRAVTLHCLRLPHKGIFWDVGAGSGSISIEAARLSPDLTIYAIERKEEELTNIKKNIRDHGCYNVVPVAGSAPDVLHDLLSPQRVFIGGSGGQLTGIIEKAVACLPDDGRLVVNGVTRKTITDAPKLMAKAGLTTRASTIHVSRSEQGKEPVSFNQISIITGCR